MKEQKLIIKPGQNYQNYVNIAKGIAISSVVLLHLHFYNESKLCEFIRCLLGNSWHVAVFFLISGFFIKTKELVIPKSFLKKKFAKLYRLLLYYYIPATLLHNALIDIGWYSTIIDYHGKSLYYFSFTDIINHLFQCFVFAGREPILGAMWFVYVLLLAFIGYSFFSWLLSRCIHDNVKYEIVRTIFLMIICMISCTFTERLDFMIPRCSNTITAIWLIHIGYLLKNRFNIEFNNCYLAISSLFIVIHCAINIGGISLNANVYRDVVMLTISTVSALYVICYISQKIENTFVGNFLDWCGKNSFHIMALHLIGFKLGIEVLNSLGANIIINTQMPELGHRIDYVIILFFFGILLPLLFISLLRFFKNIIIRHKEKIMRS